MRTPWTLSALIVCGLLLSAGAASAEEPAPAQKFDSIEELLAFLEEWDGTPDDAQKFYESLSDEEKALARENLEFWSLEGGLGIMGGAASPLSGNDDAEGRGLFRLSASFGAVWPMGAYDLPVYYALPKIPGPWAIGVQGFVQSDNFNTVAGGATLRLAYDYFGSSPFLEVGPAFRAGSGIDAAPGAHLEVGYGNILIQGVIQSEIWFDDQMPLTVVAGVRLPWLLLTLF